MQNHASHHKFVGAGAPRCNTIKEGIKMKLITIKKNLITIASVGTAIALIAFFGAVLIPLPLLFYPYVIAGLIGAAALIADILLAEANPEHN